WRVDERFDDSHLAALDALGEVDLTFACEEGDTREPVKIHLHRVLASGSRAGKRRSLLLHCFVTSGERHGITASPSLAFPLGLGTSRPTSSIWAPRDSGRY